MSELLPKMTVSELTFSLKTMLEESFFGLTVEGEISGYKPSPTGHWYFSLKDEGAVINAVVWKGMIPAMGVRPKDGMKVIVTGNINVYPPRGSYQIVCNSMRLSGEGDILAALEEKKRRYSVLGYFDEDKKKQIPQHPQKVAVITSPTGAALQDILQVTGRRNSSMDILIMPCLVQGNEAAAAIAHRIYQVSKFKLADVMIVGRGGGSIEDLLPFSDDLVIEAIYQSEVPVISAVGHEIDWAISDFAADMRAPTPSAAAELVCSSQDDMLVRINNLVMTMQESEFSIVHEKRLRLEASGMKNLYGCLNSRLIETKRKEDNFISKIAYAVKSKLMNLKTEHKVALEKINALSPNAVLERGFAIVTDENNKTLKSTDQVKTDQNIKIRLSNGKIAARVTEKL